MRRLACAAILALLCSWSDGASAQFLYLDSDGDGLSSPGDVLNAAGFPTSVSIYIDTSHNADSTAAYCDAGGDSLSINSYEFILHATGGTVTFGSYENLQASMGTTFGTKSNDTDFYVGFGGGTAFPPGLYKLGTLSITVISGSPALNPASSTPLSGSYGTSFGTRCVGHDQDNTYKLGIDWHDLAGCGPPGGGNAAPAASAPGEASVERGKLIGLTTEFSDFNPSDTLGLEVHGLPPGLVGVRGEQFDGRRQMRVYGIVPQSSTVDSSYDITWSANDGISTQIAHSTLRPTTTETPADLRGQVEDLVTAQYFHGMPAREARALGTAALPILSGMLNDLAYKPYWGQVAHAIGLVGDTAYFDTLHAFVWDRFHGSIDLQTYMAIRSAQGALSLMATSSSHAVEYLIETASQSAWSALPWTFGGPGSVPDEMSRTTLAALAYTDSDRASEVIRALPVPTDTYGRIFITGLQKVNVRVRKRGLLQELDDYEAKREGRLR